MIEMPRDCCKCKEKVDFSKNDYTISLLTKVVWHNKCTDKTDKDNVVVGKY